MKLFTRYAGSAATAAATLLALTACGGGGTSPVGDAGGGTGGGCDPAAPQTFDDCGLAWITFTDADGDVLRYSVDVLSLSLSRADGTDVQTLPAASRIDFAEYTDLTEFVTAARIPPGTYVRAAITVDFSTAEIIVERGGEAVAAQAVDLDGAPLGEYTLAIDLAERRALTITPGRPALLNVDFDLEASNEVDLASDPPRVLVSPVLLAEIVPVDEKALRVRGTLQGVDTAAGSYAVELRPLHRLTGRFGEVPVSTTPTTTFEIDGSVLAGAEGLAALAALPAESVTLAFGTLVLDPPVFTAERVLAGSSVPGIEADTVTGAVVAREGTTLTVRGAVVVRSGDPVSAFFDEVSVALDDATRVVKWGEAGDAAVAIADLSVGQRVRAFGTFTPDESGAPATLDAGAGLVQMLRSQLTGTVADTPPGGLTVAVSQLNGRDPSLYDFSGTGVSAQLDADAAAYDIDTGPLDVATLPGEGVRVFGFVNGFAMAPPDFEAFTTMDVSPITSVVRFAFGERGARDALTGVGPGGIGFNVDAISRGFLRIDGLRRPLGLGQVPPRLVTTPDGSGRYAIARDAQVTLYDSFAQFVEALAAALDGSTSIRSVTAAGPYDIATAELAARTVVVVLM